MFGKIKSIFLVRTCSFLTYVFPACQTPILSPKNILIINSQGIGDMVIFTPLIEAIKKKYPLTKISVLTSFYGAEVLKNNPYISETIIVQHLFTTVFSFMKLIKQLRKKKFDVVIDTTLTCFFIRQLLLPFLTGAPTRICFQRKGFSHFLPTHEIIFQRKHMMLLYGDIATFFGTTIYPKPTLYPLSDDRKWAKELLKNCKKPIVVVHPTCQGDEKIWPLNNFGQIISKIKKKYRGTIIVTTTPKEKDLADKINKQERCILLVVPSIQKTAALLEKTDLLVSVDTGIVHIATTTYTPTVCVYGRTSQLFWKPYNENQKVIQSTSCKEIANDVDTTQVIIHPHSCPEHGRYCINAIPVSDVWNAIQKQLQ